jgi:hypothetical protein
MDIYSSEIQDALPVIPWMVQSLSVLLSRASLEKKGLLFPVMIRDQSQPTRSISLIQFTNLIPKLYEDIIRD